MKVIGLTNGLRGDAELQCAVDFRAWLAEVENSTWGSWEELKKHYPNVSQTAGGETHFPLTADGTGVRAMILFELPLMILRCIAPSPITFRPPHRRRISLPQSK